jgi:hypothetical protein
LTIVNSLRIDKRLFIGRQQWLTTVNVLQGAISLHL